MSNWQTTLITLALLSGLVSLWMADLTRQRRLRGTLELRLLMWLMAGWSLLYAFQMSIANEPLLAALERVKYGIMSWVGMAWLILVFRLTKQDEWLTHTNLTILAVPSALSCVFALTNPGNLFFQAQTLVPSLDFFALRIQVGPWFYIFLLHTYAFTLLATIQFFTWIVRIMRRGNRPSAFVWVLLLIFPLAGLIAPLGLIRLNIDIMPLTFSFMSYALGVGVLRLRVFDLVPVAYDAVIANMPDGVLILDNKREIIAANPAFEQLSGAQAEMVAGSNIADAFPMLPAELETEAQIKWNERIIDIRVSTFVNESNDPQGYLWLFQDVTERHKIEVARGESERRYQTLFARANDAILIIDKDEKIIDANRAAVQVFGYDRAELLTLRLKDLSQSERKESLQNSKTRRLEMNIRRRNGSLATLDLSLAPFISGDNTMLLLVARDVTERKRAERDLTQRISQLQILREVSDEINDKLSIDHVLLMALDAAMRLSAANAGFIVLFGENRVVASQAIGNYKHSNGLFPLEMADPVIRKAIDERAALHIKAINTDSDAPTNRLPTTQSQLVVPLVSRDQVIGLLNLEANRLDRFTEEAFAFMQLLADRIAVAMENAGLYRQAQTQILELQKLYEQVSYLESIKTDMIQIAAHDLRNPLSVMLGYLTLLEMDMDQYHEDVGRAVRVMLTSTRRMNTLIDEILSIDRIEKLASQKESDPFDIVHQAREVVKEFQWQGREKKLHFESILHPHALIVLGDAPQIYEAMGNLISNAIKYTPEGGSIRVTLQIEEKYVVYRVIDTGFGIPEDQQDKLFKRYSRMKTEETQKIKGSGLGLYLVKNIIERYGGNMLFHSVYGKGSMFGFRLPLHEIPTPTGDVFSDTLS